MLQTARSRGLFSLPVLSLATVWLVWGSTYFGIRVAVQSLPPLLMSGSRYVVAGAIVALFIWITQRGRLAPVRWEHVKSILVSAVLLIAIGNGALTVAEVWLPSGIAAILVASVPIWMLLIDACFTRTINAQAMLGVAVGTIGIAALVGVPSAGVPLLPAIAVIGGAVSWGLGSVLARRHASEHTHPLYLALEMLAGGSIMCLAGLVSGELASFHPAHVPAGAIGGWLWLIVMGAIVGYSAYGYAVRTLPTNVVSTYAYVNPIVAVILGTLLLHEPMTPIEAIGGGGVIVAVIVILMAGRPRETPTVVEAPEFVPVVRGESPCSYADSIIAHEWPEQQRAIR